jgi:hypothetical protein
LPYFIAANYPQEEFTMKNVGTVDKVIRIILGLVLIALVFVGPQTPWGWIGIIPLVTGLIGFCPLYSVLGMNTCGAKKA